ncbi:MAG: 16S rRNA (uracil(1498)-N(3))-methyltransferase [Tatlockia sp.]
MREVRIYQPGTYKAGQSFELSAEAGHHVGVVLRMKQGDKLTLFCGDNREFSAVIETLHKKKVSVHILNECEVSRESPRAMHLAQALSKGERMEFVIQKAVELGVTSITPLMTARSVVKLDNTRLEKKQAQWQAIAIAACEQSGRNTVPNVNPVQYLADYLHGEQALVKLVLHPGEAKTWRDYPLASESLALLIGPEGGFATEEMPLIFSAGFKPLCLGPRVLRTETAAIAALSVLQAVCGDL